MIAVTIAAEGMCDIAAIGKIATSVGFSIGNTYDCRGKSKLDHRLNGFLAAAMYSPWIIVRDLDTDSDCAPSLLASKGIVVPDLACLRIAVPSLESWIFADKHNFGDWLGIPIGRLPRAPEQLANPKHTLAQLAASSRKRVIQQRMAPRPQDGASVGPEYGAALYEYIVQHWDLHAALQADLSTSLRGAVECIERLFLRCSS